MKQLLVLIDPEWPHAQTECDWQLLDARGRRIAEGRSAPRHWPGVVVAATDDQAAGDTDAAVQTRLILVGHQVACQRLQLPAGRAGRRPEIIAAGLEDSVLEATDDLLLLHLGDDVDSGESMIGVLARARLQTVLHACDELGLDVAAVFADGQCLPQREGRRAGWVDRDHLLLPLGDAGFVTITLAVDTAALVLQLERAAALGVRPPTHLLLHPKSAPTVANTLSVAVTILGDALARVWPDAPPAQIARGDLVCPPGQPGFLIEQFAARRGRALGRILRPALVLTAVCAFVAVLALAGDTLALSFQRDSLRADIATRFQTMFPQAAMVDPLLQTRRQLAERRARAGQLATGDLLSMLDALATQVDVELIKAEYTHEHLAAQLQLTPHAAAVLPEALQNVGYRATVAKSSGMPAPPLRDGDSGPRTLLVKLQPHEVAP